MQKLKVEDLAQKVSILQLYGAAFAMIGKLQMDFNQEMMLQSRVRSWSFIAKTLTLRDQKLSSQKFNVFHTFELGVYRSAAEALSQDLRNLAAKSLL